mmetsp:Transcript_3137/g.8668  ORF Transcript_3137/g.8668 Transcript_3137/m.8668 type:complete len:108 (-) Transcript_3137:135-458(-)
MRLKNMQDGFFRLHRRTLSPCHRRHLLSSTVRMPSIVVQLYAPTLRCSPEFERTRLLLRFIDPSLRCNESDLEALPRNLAVGGRLLLAVLCRRSPLLGAPVGDGDED